MYNFPLTRFLHMETKKPMHIPASESDWPRSWKIVEFKEYPRMPRTVLPPPRELPVRADDMFARRASARFFDASHSCSVEDVSTLLHWSSGVSRNKEIPEISRRFYASGGARYPLEVYISARGGAGLEAGVYHYNVKVHSLEKLLGAEGDGMLRNVPNYPFVKDASVVLVVSALFERTTRKYRERGYRFVHLDAGALIQNFYLVAGAMGLGCCASGVPADEAMERILGIHSNETYLLMLAIGKPAEI